MNITQISYACKTQNIENLTNFIQKGINLNNLVEDFDILSNDLESTPIIYAIRHNKELLLNFLLSQNYYDIDLNKADKNGMTPLILSLSTNNFKMFEQLLIKGANLLECIDYLLDIYINFNKAINKKILYLIKRLHKLNLISIDAYNFILYKLIEKIILYKPQNNKLYSCQYFHETQKLNFRKHKKILDFLYKNITDVNANIIINNSSIPLIFFLVNADVKSYKWIKLAKKQNLLNITNSKQQNILMYSCIGNTSKVSNILIKYLKKNINLQDIDGNTALHLAIHNNNFAAMQSLLLNNANINIKNYQDISCKEIINKFPDTLQLLILNNFNNIDLKDLITNYLPEFIECFYFNPRDNKNIYSLILNSEYISQENRILLQTIYNKIFIKTKSNINEVYANIPQLKSKLIGQYGFESECSRLYWQPFSSISKIEYILTKLFKITFSQDLNIPVSTETHIQLEVKSRILKTNNQLIDFFCVQQFLQLHGVYKCGGDDHIHIGIKQLIAQKFNIEIDDDLFHMQIVKQILLYFVRYWHIFSQVAHGNSTFDYIPFGNSPKFRALFIQKLLGAKSLREILYLIQNHKVKDHPLQFDIPRYTIFNLLNYYGIGTLEIRCFTLREHYNQLQPVEPYGSLYSILLCEAIFKQSLQDIINLYKHDIKLTYRNNAIKDIFLTYVSNIQTANIYAKTQTPHFSRLNISQLSYIKKVRVTKYLMDYLAIKNIKNIFGIPGRENADIAFNENSDIKYITARIEFNAGVMADTAARLSKSPQVAFCTTGPGATNMVTACAGAYFSFSPVLIISAQVEQGVINYNKTHQCLNQKEIFTSVTKWSYEVQSSKELPDVLDKAFNLMMQEPKGPVHISIPINLYHDYIEDDNLTRHQKFIDNQNILFEKSILIDSENSEWNKKLNSCLSILKKYNNILCLVGHEAIRANAQDNIVKLCEGLNIPLLTSANAHGILPYEHKLNLGAGSCYMDGILEMPNCMDLIMQDVEVIINIGYQLADDIPPTMWERGRSKIIIDISAVADYHHLYSPDPKFRLNGDINSIIKILIENLSEYKKDDYLDYAANRLKQIKQNIYDNPLKNGFIGASDVVKIINNNLSEDGILLSDIGYYRHHAILFGRFKRTQNFIVDAALSSFGYGLPAGIGAQISYPEREVYVICGDGGFHSGSGDLETVVRYNLPIVIFLLNNQSFDLINRYQKKGDAINPDILKFSSVDFAKLAQANGMKGVKINTLEELEYTLLNRDKQKPILIEIPLQYHDQRFVIGF